MEPTSVEQVGRSGFMRCVHAAIDARIEQAQFAISRTTWLTMIKSSAGGITRTVTGEFSAEI